MLTIPVFLAVTAAYMVKGMCGFANTLVFGTLAGFFTDNVNISPVDLLLGYPSNLWIAWTERNGIRPKIWIPLSLLVIAGSISRDVLSEDREMPGPLRSFSALWWYS